MLSLKTYRSRPSCLPSVRRIEFLERKLQGKLDNARGASADDLTKAPAPEGRSYTIKVRVVPGVEHLRPELRVPALLDLEVLEEAHVPVVAARTADDSDSGIPKMTKRGR